MYGFFWEKAPKRIEQKDWLRLCLPSDDDVSEWEIPVLRVNWSQFWLIHNVSWLILLSVSECSPQEIIKTLFAASKLDPTLASPEFLLLNHRTDGLEMSGPRQPGDISVSQSATEIFKYNTPALTYRVFKEKHLLSRHTYVIWHCRWSNDKTKTILGLAS